MKGKKRVAILIEDTFEDMELLYPYFRLQEAGFAVDLVGTKKEVTYLSKHNYPVKSKLSSGEVKADDYATVIIPGGYSPDKMRRCPETLNFVKEMDKQGKPIAAICHGPWVMASCCNLKDKKMTAFDSIKDDLINAGAHFVDQEVVVDGNLITSRTPVDLIPFTLAIIKAIT